MPPKSARLVVVAWSATGLAACAVAFWRTLAGAPPTSTEFVLAATVGALLAANEVWPVAVHRGGESGAVDLGGACFVLLVLLVPAALTVLVFAVVTVAVQAIMGRPLARAAFNVGHVTTAAALGALLFTALGGAHAAHGYAKVGAAVLGAVCALVVDTGARVSIASVLGEPWTEVVVAGMGERLLVMGGGIAVAIPAGLLLAQDPRYLPLAVLPLVVLRHLGAGHLAARRDRAALRGLFDATLHVNRSLGTEDAETALLGAAGSLLRSTEVTLTTRRPEGDGLAAPIVLTDRTLWLGVSGRGQSGAFGEADRALLDALASAGAVALANAALHGQVRAQQETLSVIARSLGEGVCAVDESGALTFMNPSGASMLGWYGLGAGVDGPDIPPGPVPEFLLEPAMRAIALQRNVTSDDARFERLDGSCFPAIMTASPVVDGGSSSRAVIVFRDTSERRAFEEQLARHAFQDALTGLANRRLLLDHLDHALLQAERTGSRVAVLFCDIDCFKVVNDNLGHQVGDELLRVIGDRLRRVVRPGDTLSRFGGDEFVILLEGVTGPEDSSRVVTAALDALREPVSLSGGHDVVATMSIGVALSEHGMCREDLLHDADVAMYHAKERGRGGQRGPVYVDRMGVRSVDRPDLEAALHHAVDRGEVEVHYQPLVSLAECRIVGAEALVRWNHPEHGLLLPGRFITLAEDNGSIVPIGRFVLDQACRQVKTWQQELGVTIGVGVNLSAREFKQPDLAEEVAAALRDSHVDPSLLCVDVAEGLAMDDLDLTAHVVGSLHALGVRMAIDDFGTGHSSLGYLTRFGVDAVKIDQSFVHGIDHDPVKSAIVSAVVALCRAVGTTTVAEGVETPVQLEEVRLLGCGAAQGSYFARPMSAGSFGRLLAAGAGTPPELRLRRGFRAGPAVESEPPGVSEPSGVG